MAYQEIINEIQEQIDETLAQIAQYEADIVQHQADIEEKQAFITQFQERIVGLQGLRTNAMTLSEQAQDVNVNLNVRVLTDDSGTVSVVNHDVSPN